jgi:hypothetical protein
LLQSDFLVGERNIPDILYDFLGTFQRQNFEIFDFLSKVLLNEVYLDGAGLVRIQLIEDLLNLLVMEKDMRRVRVQEQEVVYESFTGAEIYRSDRALLLGGLFQEADI